MVRNCVVTLGIVACCGLGCGDEATDPLSVVGPEPAAAPGQAVAGPIGLDQAEQIALAAVPGEVVGTETETEDGREVIEVEIQTADGVVCVEVDATTGAIPELGWGGQADAKEDEADAEDEAGADEDDAAAAGVAADAEDQAA